MIMIASIKITNEIYISQKNIQQIIFDRKILQHKLMNTKLFLLVNQAAHNISGPWVSGSSHTALH